MSNTSVTKSEMNHALREQTDEISSLFETFMQRVDDRFNKAEAETQEIKQSIHALTNTIDGFIKRLDQVESEQRMRDAQFDRLVTWAKKVSEKTGIPLENL